MKKIVLALLLLLALITTVYFFFLQIEVTAKPPFERKLNQQSMQIEGLTRDFSYYLSSNLKQNAALIFALHGSMSTGADIRQQTAFQFEHLAEQKNLIIVYPNGYKRHWNDCRASASYAANQENIDDIAFFKSMIAYFQAQYDIDTSSVYATGISNGGHMVYRLGLEMPSEFSALAAMAANLPVDENLDCDKSKQPVSMAIFNGTNDPVNPYEGGLISILGNDSRGTVHSSLTTAQYWAGLFDSRGKISKVVLNDADDNPETSISIMTWRSSKGDQVRLYTLEGSGHVVPSKLVSFPFVVGGNAGDIEAAYEIWDFFSAVKAVKTTNPDSS